VVTETATPEKLAIIAFLSNWNIAPAVDDAQFSFVRQGPSDHFHTTRKTGGSEPLKPTGGKS